MNSFAAKVSSFLRHGLDLESQVPIHEKETRFIDEIAKKAKELHLVFPLLAFVLGLRPAAFLVKSVLTGLEPFAELFFPEKIYAEFLEFAGKRSALESLIEKLEQESP